MPLNHTIESQNKSDMNMPEFCGGELLFIVSGVGWLSTADKRCREGISEREMTAETHDIRKCSMNQSAYFQKCVGDAFLCLQVAALHNVAS